MNVLVNYDSWKLTDWREEREETMKIMIDYHLEQKMIEEVKKINIANYFRNFKDNLIKQYQFNNLEIAEFSIVDVEETEDSMIYTIQVIWSNIEEIVLDSEEEIKECIQKDINKLLEDDRTIIVDHEIDSKVEYEGV
ncbi:hypothetical protein HKO22_03020 [Peptoniphilus sp. AGMB00490]|uniref:Uncharacterized protein n=1 Tax=Peptoniphilus faecalis TaxID=2731255 RepID=A0A848RHI7_9FIRM|nr:hypothetical protein [Peptoniphilus faecalis]NMW84716.1 hypothetical protein [Peptoniphilus faecalis]